MSAAISASVVSCPRLKRSVEAARSSDTPSANSTCDGSTFAPAHAAPALHAMPHVQDADPLRSAELMRRQAHQVDAPIREAQRNRVWRLHAIRMEGDAPSERRSTRTNSGCDFNYRLDRADLVVRRHDAHEQSAVCNSSGHLGRIDEPIAVHRHVRDIEAEALQVLTAVQHGVMLDCRRYDVVART